MEAGMNGKVYGNLDLDSAVCMLQGGASFGDVFPCVGAADRDELRRVFCFDPNCGPVPQSKQPPPRVGPTLPPMASGNGCKTCGGLMVRAGKCEYCPQGCGSEGECS